MQSTMQLFVGQKNHYSFNSKRDYSEIQWHSQPFEKWSQEYDFVPAVFEKKCIQMLISKRKTQN